MTSTKVKVLLACLGLTSVCLINLVHSVTLPKELGLRNVNSPNDIAAMYDYLGRANNKSSSNSTGTMQQVTPVGLKEVMALQ